MWDEKNILFKLHLAVHTDLDVEIGDGSADPLLGGNAWFFKNYFVPLRQYYS